MTEMVSSWPLTQLASIVFFIHSFLTNWKFEITIETCLPRDDIGLVECNVLEENGERFVKAIGKHTTDEGCSSYLGTLAIPLSDRSFVFSLHARELGLTGYRAATILDKLIREGHSIELDPVTRQIRGWAQDPYFPDYQGPCLRNLSEDEKFDHLFPEHPLTKVRFRINEIVDFVLS